MQHCKTVNLQFKKNLEKEMYFSYCAEICLLVNNPPLHLQCTHILALVLSTRPQGTSQLLVPRGLYRVILFLSTLAFSTTE